MKKIYLSSIILILGILIYPNIVNAGLSEGCSAFTCPTGQDYYAGDCKIHIEDLNDCTNIPDSGYQKAFNCTVGCTQSFIALTNWKPESGKVWYSAGNVGIGTTDPLAKVHAIYDDSTYSMLSGIQTIGSINYHAGAYGVSNGTSSLTDVYVGVVGESSGGSGIMGTSTSGTGGYFASTTGNGLIVGNGNVGIGTDTPDTKLDVNGDILGDSMNLSGNFTAIGNVGIGIGIPETKFHIKDAGNVYARIENNTGNQSAIQFADSSDVGEWVVGIHGGDANRFKIAQSTALHINTALTIDENLNVGIGTSSPAQKLHIYDSNSVGTPRWDSYLTVESSGQVAMQLLGGNGYSSILFGSSSNDGQIGYSSQLPTQFDFTVGDEVVMVITDGYVSPFAANASQSFNLGSSTRAWENIYMDGYLYDADDTSYYVNPAGITKLQTLYIDGRMYDMDNTSYYVNPGATTIFDSLTVNSFTNTSDIRLKENVKDLEYGLGEVMKLRPVSFNWKDKEADNVIGLIAQEVQPIVDEVVRFNEDDEDKMLGIAYTELIPVLISAIQEQQQLIEDLTIRIEDIENKLQ